MIRTEDIINVTASVRIWVCITRTFPWAKEDWKENKMKNNIFCKRYNSHLILCHDYLLFSEVRSVSWFLFQGDAKTTVECPCAWWGHDCLVGKHVPHSSSSLMGAGRDIGISVSCSLALVLRMNWRPSLIDSQQLWEVDLDLRNGSAYCGISKAMCYEAEVGQAGVGVLWIRWSDGVWASHCIHHSLELC